MTNTRTAEILLKISTRLGLQPLGVVYKVHGAIPIGVVTTTEELILIPRILYTKRDHPLVLYKMKIENRNRSRILKISKSTYRVEYLDLNV